MKTRIHVNQHNIKRNTKKHTRDPVLTVKTYKSNIYGHEAIIDGHSKVIYRPQTESKVKVVLHEEEK